MTLRPFAITLDPHSSLANHTGTWRTERPVFVHGAAPCHGACPATEDPQAWLFHAEAGNYEAAWRTLVASNPFPAVMGRVCYRPCEAACNRGLLDEPVGISAVERFLGDTALERGWRLERPAPPTGRRVLVVGAGPSGLAAACHLRHLGHEVEVHDAEHEPGGMMRFGIPRYRLPRDVLAGEIERILGLGVQLHTRSRIDTHDALTDGRFDAAFVAVGAHLPHHAEIPASDSSRILDAATLLHDLELGAKPSLGRRVVVYGGGDTALDAARTAKRLGSDALVVYRRTRNRMPAHDGSMHEAEEEGVHMRWLSTIKHVGRDGVEVERMELDDAGRPVPTGERDHLGADALILAIGQTCDLGFLRQVPGVEIDPSGVVRVDDAFMTGRAGIFCGGDAVSSERTVTNAVGHGAAVARSIHRFLGGPPAGAEDQRPPASFDRLNTWYFSDAPREVRPVLEAARRTSGFDEVTGGLDGDSALFEARRCLSCGNCMACDNCYGMCPDNAVIKHAPDGPYAYSIDLDHCKGCGICAQECPVGAISMVPEII